MYPAQLSNLVVTVSRLYTIASLILPRQGEYSKVAAQLKTILDRLHLLQFVHEYPTIAVCGQQGVGKTALMRTLYEIPGVLPETVGRDERTPIRIVEHRSKNLEAWELRTNRENGKISSLRIEVSELGPRARDEDEAFAFELRVPQRYFKSMTNSPQTRRAWLLLPGREDNKQEWDRRTMAAMKMADTCLLVSNSTRIADRGHQKFIEQLKTHFGTQPLAVAVTAADKSDDRNKQAAKKIQQLMGVPPELVVATDASDRGERDWIEKLCAAVERSLAERKPVEARLDELDDLIADDLGNVIEQIDEYLNADYMRASIRESTQITPVLDALAIAIAALRREIQTRLSEEFQGLQRDQIKEWQKYVGSLGFVEAIRTTFGGTVEQRVRFHEKLESLWQDSNVNVATQRAIETALQNRYQVIAKVGAKNPDALLAKSTRLALPASSGEAGKVSQGLERERFFQPEDWENIDYLSGKDVLPNRTLQKTVNHLPLFVLAAALMRYKLDESAAAAVAKQPLQQPGTAAVVLAPEQAKEGDLLLAPTDVIKALGQASSLYAELVKALGVLATAGGAAETKLDAPARLASALNGTPPPTSPGVHAPTLQAPPASSALNTIGAAATGAVTATALHGAAAPAVAGTAAAAAPAVAAAAVTPAVAGTAAAAAPAVATTAAAAPVGAGAAAAAAAVPGGAGGSAAMGGILFVAAIGLTVAGGFAYRQILREEYKLGEWGSLTLQSWAEQAVAATLGRYDENMLRVRERLAEVLLARHGLDQKLGQRQRLVAAKDSCKQSLNELRSALRDR